MANDSSTAIMDEGEDEEKEEDKEEEEEEEDEEDEDDEEEEAPHESDSNESFHAPNTPSEIDASAEDVDSALAAPKEYSYKKVTAVLQIVIPSTNCCP